MVLVRGDNVSVFFFVFLVLSKVGPFDLRGRKMIYKRSLCVPCFI